MFTYNGRIGGTDRVYSQDLVRVVKAENNTCLDAVPFWSYDRFTEVSAIDNLSGKQPCDVVLT